LSVEADEDTSVEIGGDAGTGPNAGGAAKSQRKTWSTVVKQSASSAAAAVSAVKVAEIKKKREVELEEEEEDEATEESPVAGDRPARRSESPVAKRQWELVEKTSEDALCRGLEAQRTAAAAQARMPAAIRPRFFRPKPHVSAVTR
jgi:hypothetical protein